MRQSNTDTTNLTMHSKRKKTYPPYEMAKMLISLEAPHLCNSNQYAVWWKQYKIAYLPRYPERYYSNFSWSDFLDTEIQPYWSYVAEKKRLSAIQHRPLWDAVRWAQQYCREKGIVTRRQWEESYNSATEIPENIPKYPHSVYKSDGYPGFRVWCGRDATAIAESRVNETAIVALVHVANQPQNIVKWISADSQSELVDLWHKQDTYDRLLGCWELESDTKSQIDNIMANIGVTGDDYHTVPNLHQFLYDLNTTLLMVRL